MQWVSVSLAAAGVVYLTVALGAPPWIALSLAASFGAYGLMKKVAPLSAVQGLALETAILFLPAAAYLISEELAGNGALLHSGFLRDHEPFTRVQLIGFGLVWAALALFAVEGYVTHRWPQLGVTEVS